MMCYDLVTKGKAGNRKERKGRHGQEGQGKEAMI